MPSLLSIGQKMVCKTGEVVDDQIFLRTTVK